jgi:hypothetical protein
MVPVSPVGIEDDSRSAGAPVNEIEITPKMIEAGERVIWRALCGSILIPDVRPDVLAKEVFEAMEEASQA